MLAMTYPGDWTADNGDFDGDAALVARALDKDLAAFERLTARYQKKLIAYAAHMLNDVTEAEDVVQEAFIKAYVSLETFRGASSFSTWIYRITTNLCIDRQRTRSRRPKEGYSLDAPVDKEDEASGGHEIADTSYEPSRAIEADELRRIVRETVAALPPKQRQVVVMFDLQGASYEAIARDLKLPIGTVKSRLFHARAELSRRLRPYVSGAR